MYLGDENVRTLATYIYAYGQARIDLGVSEFGVQDPPLLAEFEKWLAHGRHGAWPSIIREEAPGDRSVRHFFVRFEEFLAERGHSLSGPSDVVWPPDPWPMSGIPRDE
jgi:hypothetical protein